MQPRSVEQRLTSLEEQMSEMRELPERVTELESQIVQSREVIRDEVSAFRGAMKAGDDDTRVFMRVLYEDVLARLEVIGEHDGADGSGE